MTLEDMHQHADELKLECRWHNLIYEFMEKVFSMMMIIYPARKVIKKSKFMFSLGVIGQCLFCFYPEDYNHTFVVVNQIVITFQVIQMIVRSLVLIVIGLKNQEINLMNVLKV